MLLSQKLPEIVYVYHMGDQLAFRENLEEALGKARLTLHATNFPTHAAYCDAVCDLASQNARHEVVFTWHIAI